MKLDIFKMSIFDFLKILFFKKKTKNKNNTKYIKESFKAYMLYKKYTNYQHFYSVSIIFLKKKNNI